MPFSLRNALATFQRQMSRMVADLSGCAVHLNGVVIFSDTLGEHLQGNRALFDVLMWAQVTTIKTKREFARAAVT